MSLNITFTAPNGTTLNDLSGEGGTTFVATNYSAAGAAVPVIVDGKVTSTAGARVAYLASATPASADSPISAEFVYSTLIAEVGVIARGSLNNGYLVVADFGASLLRLLWQADASTVLQLGAPGIPALTVGESYAVVTLPQSWGLALGLFRVSDGHWWDTQNGVWQSTLTWCGGIGDNQITATGHPGIVFKAEAPTDGASAAGLDNVLIDALPTAANAPPTFPGPDIANITAVDGAAPVEVTTLGKWADTDALTLSASPDGTPWPTWLTIDPTTKRLVVTPPATSGVAITVTGLRERATDTAGGFIDSNAFSVTIQPPAVNTGRRRVSALLAALMAIGIVSGADATVAAPAPPQPPAQTTAPDWVDPLSTWPGLPTLLGGVSITQHDLPASPGSFISEFPYGGFKHCRYCWVPSLGAYLVLGGDYGRAPGGSGSNELWKVTPAGTAQNPTYTFELMTPGSTPGVLAPGRVDEAMFACDTLRNRCLHVPYNRWELVGSPLTIEGTEYNLMCVLDVATMSWTRLPNNDPNGHPYPIYNGCKWGPYDPVNDCYYVLEGTSTVYIINASDFTMQWPPTQFGQSSPYDTYSQSWGNACPIFDWKRRRIVSPAKAINGNLADPRALKLVCWDMDAPHAAYYLPQENTAWDPKNPPYLNFEASYHLLNEAKGLDHYVIQGGALRVADSEYDLKQTSDIRVIPADGGLWRRYESDSAITLPKRRGQAMHPSHLPGSEAGEMMLAGGIDDDVADAKPEFYRLRFKPSSTQRPSWRPPANRWGRMPLANLLSEINAETNPAINPNYPNPAPWHGVSGQGAMFRSWCSLAHDKRTHRSYACRLGGHDDIWENADYMLDASGDVPFVRLIGWPSGAVGNPMPSSAWAIAQSDTGFLPDGRTPSMHTYNGQCYVPGLGVFISRLTAMAPVGHNQRIAVAVNPHNGKQTVLKDYNGALGVNNDSSNQAATYDPTRDCVWWLANAQSCLQKYDRATGQLTPYGTRIQGFLVPDDLAGGMVWMEYLEHIDALIVIDGIYGLQLIDCKAPDTRYTIAQAGNWVAGFGAFSGAGAQVAGALSTGWSIVGADWDPIDQQLLLWHNTINREVVSTLKPSGTTFASYIGSAWQRGALPVDAGNTVIPSTPCDQGTFRRMWLDPEYGTINIWNSPAEPPYVLAKGG